MEFKYRYQTSDNETLEKKISARSRQDAYARLKKLGIKPMAVVQCPLTPAQKAVRALVFAFIALAVALVAYAIVWAARKTAPRQEIVQEVVALAVVEGGKTNIVPQVTYPAPAKPAAISSPIIAVGNGTVRKGTAARPLARQAIRGDRVRLEKSMKTLFENPGDAFLASYAEPGRKVSVAFTDEISSNLVESVKTPIIVFDDELTECVDLKRIVAGMKAELKGYLADGGTVEEYVSELAARQQEEVEFREKLEEKLAELAKTASRDELYSAWLKSEAALKSWGIAPTMMPRELQGYQPDFDFDDLPQ